MSLRDDILAISDSKVSELFVPEWDKIVHIRTLTGAERARFPQAWPHAGRESRAKAHVQRRTQRTGPSRPAKPA